jgi:dTDP-4-amino-4,6-dideoxygalactose transaminase
MRVPFNRPSIAEADIACILDAADRRRLSGGGHFTRLCHEWLERRLGVTRALLTHSGTGALEMAALLSDVGPGDEVIMPSFTFSSTANAFVLRGAVPVFADIRPDTLNLDPEAAAAAITDRTRVIVPVHYAGVACDMTALSSLAARHGLLIIEDAAQALLATHDDRPLGSVGHAAALSFHETKNIACGEGGALLLRDGDWAARAEIAWEKGTNRAAFHRGEVDKYTWCEAGSSFLPSEISAALLWSQLNRADEITAARRSIWQRYHDGFAALEARGLLQRPVVPADTGANAHIYYLLLPTADRLTAVIAAIRAGGVDAVRHYVPLHSAPAGRRFGRAAGPLSTTNSVAERLVRLPLWSALPDADVDFVIDTVTAAVTR